LVAKEKRKIKSNESVTYLTNLERLSVGQIMTLLIISTAIFYVQSQLGDDQMICTIIIVYEYLSYCLDKSEKFFNLPC